MFDQARKLVLSDRAKALRALSDELKRHEQDEIDAELDALEAEERERIATQEAEAARAQRIAEADARADDIRKQQYVAAAEFDAALASANTAFERLEDLSVRLTDAEREAGRDRGRPAAVGHARTTALVSAMWNSARPLSKRLRLSAVPGGPSKIRPLTAVYPNNERKEP